jgi:NADH-quinone oxidoreductase subunit L
MEGPTPISALIHAATMVTAGIFMVARMSPLFEFSEYALNFVLFIGATTALFMGFLGIINNDIKRVVAYSTLSQLGYMTVALARRRTARHLPPDDARLLQGAAVPRGRLGDHRHAPRAGHAQDGRLSQVHEDHRDHLLDRHAGADRHAVLLGFYSKDLIIDAVQRAAPASRQRHRHLRYWCVMIGVFVTAFYSFRCCS